jgi:hypothetical protein
MQPRRRRLASIHLTLTTLFCSVFFVAGVGAAETAVYDVKSVDVLAAFNTTPRLGMSDPRRIEIVDSGPETSDGGPRWVADSPQIAVWDQEPADLSTPELRVFGNHCAELALVLWQGSLEGALPRVVRDSTGGGYFAWLSGPSPPAGAMDPYAFFCLKGSHQSTTSYSEYLMIGRRVYETAPPPPAQQVTVALATNQLVTRSVPVKISATGFAAGPLRYFISIDKAQKWFWYTSATTITQWWGTTACPNGTHSVTVRVTDTAGKTATSSVTVLVRN